MVTTSRCHCSGTSGSLWAATIATYCPGRMVEHTKSKSPGGFYRPDLLPCRVANKTRFVFVAAPSLKSVSFFLADANARNERVERRTRTRRDRRAEHTSQHVFCALLVLSPLLPLSFRYICSRRRCGRRRRRRGRRTMISSSFSGLRRNL